MENVRLMLGENYPLVSIVITTYKRSNLLNRAIDSVLSQTYDNIEILVIDDNDPDSGYREETESLMQYYLNHSKVHYIKHSENKNGATARNTGLKKAQGHYVTYLDDDDEYRPDKVFEQVKYLEQHNEFDAVYCGWNKDRIEETPSKEGDLSFEILSGELLIRTNTIMMKKEIALSIGGWNENYRRNQEAVYLLRFFNSGYKIGSVQKVLVDYDSSDRGNASGPQKNEEDFRFFLNNHENEIENAARKNNRNKNIIYSKRYVGVLLRYLKFKDYNNAFRIYWEQVKKIPIRYNVDLTIYTYNKIKEIIYLKQK